VTCSDTGYVLIALVLEAASGLPLAALYRRMLRFDALGLRTVYLEKLEPGPAGSGPRLRHQAGGVDASDIDPTCEAAGDWSATRATWPYSGVWWHTGA
jgi:CubicO group peptidase (beta-lactamase class C family)